MSNRIEHLGVINAIEGYCLHVAISQSSACAECKVAGHCNASESKNKIIDIITDKAGEYSIGESVKVSTTNEVGMMATIYAYVLPLVIMMTVLIVVKAIIGSDGWAAVSALLSLIPYYFCVYVLRNRISRQVFFEIEKINN
jgi:sigma-E factor negative regulatory protein RseC